MVEALWLAATIPAALAWLAVLLSPWRPWSTRERLEVPEGVPPAENLDDVTVLIPARDEAACIGRTLAALRAQGEGLRVLVVDDGSSDGTRGAAEAAGPAATEVIAGADLPSGWTGKLWALEQGLARVRTPWTLLLDADIELAPGVVATLRTRLRGQGVQLVSLMATLGAEGFWERLLLPAFVFFFKLLYPFRLANSPGRRVAAAAGGCVLAETAALRRVGAFACIRGELIDDCALAERFKSAGMATWIGLSRGAVSHRRYRGLSPIWEMVARTAYTQLRTSPLLLAGCLGALAWVFLLPLAGLLAPFPAARTAAVAALALMTAAYLPTLRYYGRSPAWALLLPLAGTLYLAMTADSARRFHLGVRSRWKDRSYAVDLTASPGGTSLT
jgi:hopene-associated glycosyltransferase HpnB